MFSGYGFLRPFGSKRPLAERVIIEEFSIERTSQTSNLKPQTSNQ